MKNCLGKFSFYHGEARCANLKFLAVMNGQSAARHMQDLGIVVLLMKPILRGQHASLPHSYYPLDSIPI